MPVENRSTIVVRDLSRDDLPFVVEQHLHHFPRGFFARLGPRFLTEYYRSFLTSAHACSLVATDEQDRVGYLIGVVEPALHRSHVLRAHRRGLAARAAVALAARPRLLVEFMRLRARKYLRKLFVSRTPEGGTAGGGGPTAVLAHFAVPSVHRRRGAGSMLIARFESVAVEAGASRVVLVTETGGRGDAFYRAHRWTSLGEHTTPDGLSLTTFVRSVSAEPSAEGAHAIED